MGEEEGMVCSAITSTLVWMAWCLVLLCPVRSQAQPLQEPPPLSVPDDARPWAAGVPEAEQAIATELYAAGNREFVESKFADALTKYSEALVHWDHPAIRFNLAICLIHLDKPAAARDHLERSLQFGAAPLGTALYSQGLTYRKLLDAQLAHVTITCAEPDAVVTLDGKYLFSGPGASEPFLLPGEHELRATKRGFLTASRVFIGAPGKASTYRIALEPTPLPRVVRRWDAWKPWAVLAGGGAIVGLGALSYAAARSEFAAYDRAIASRCPTGCDAAVFAGLSDIQDRKRSADLQQVLAWTLVSAGGAAAIAGAVGVVLNQPRQDVDTNRRSMIVTLMPRGAAVAASWRF